SEIIVINNNVNIDIKDPHKIRYQTSTVQLLSHNTSFRLLNPPHPNFQLPGSLSALVHAHVAGSFSKLSESEDSFL
ncbi:hypothetical protein D6D10_04683, partial [Aureobasidium pullulans]